ncbi:MAG: peptidoglycan-binding protein [Propionicimonas sp.]
MVVGMALSLGAAVVQAPSAEAIADSSKTKFIVGLASAAQSTQRKFGVPASVSMAQAIEASDWGASPVVAKANNYFDTGCSGSMAASQYAALADAQVGKPYVLGANGPKQFDCSSLVIWLNNQSGAFRMADDTAAGMYNRSRAVRGSPAVGDMVFLRNNPARSNGIGHMAVVTEKLANGDWRIIEARGRAFGVVRSTLSYWKQRSYYAGLRRLAKFSLANSGGVTTSAASLYQSGCVTIGSIRYAQFTSMTNSFYGHAAAVLNDAAYKPVRAFINNIPGYVDAIAKVEHPKDAANYAKTIRGLIGTYNLTSYDVVPFELVLLSGDKGTKVTALQYLLLAGGTRLKTTGVYDSATVSAIKKFQSAKGLGKDGEAGPQTLGALFSRVPSGATGDKVKALHAMLAALGRATTPGSTFGKETLASLKAFQATAGRSPSGVVDVNTWALLFMTPDQAPAPAVSGTARVTQTLTATVGKWGQGAFALAYQWYRAGNAIDGATTSSYTLQPADAGASVSAAVTGTRPGYTTVTRFSAPTAAVANAQLTSTPTPKISGKVIVGKPLAATAGIWSPDPVTLSYQWYRGSTAIAGATTGSYALQAADLGAKLTVVVTGTRPGFETVTKASEATGAVAAATLTAKNPKISGTRKVGKTLTAVPGTWSPSGVTLTYGWYRGSAKVAGATKVTYKLVKADKGKKISVRVRGTLAGYRTVEKASGRAQIR